MKNTFLKKSLLMIALSSSADALPGDLVFPPFSRATMPSGQGLKDDPSLPHAPTAEDLCRERLESEGLSSLQTSRQENLYYEKNFSPHVLKARSVFEAGQVLGLNDKKDSSLYAFTRQSLVLPATPSELPPSCFSAKEIPFSNVPLPLLEKSCLLQGEKPKILERDKEFQLKMRFKEEAHRKLREFSEDLYQEVQSLLGPPPSHLNCRGEVWKGTEYFLQGIKCALRDSLKTSKRPLGTLDEESLQGLIEGGMSPQALQDMIDRSWGPMSYWSDPRIEAAFKDAKNIFLKALENMQQTLKVAHVISVLDFLSD